MADSDNVREPPSYEDFEVSIGPPHRGTYPILVVRSPAGDLPGVMRLRLPKPLRDPIRGFEEAVFGVYSDKTRNPVERRNAFNRKALRDFGKALFEALVSGEVLSSFRESLNRVRDERKDLRLKLRIQSPELAALPWEFLYDPNADEYVCLLRRTSIVRYLESSMGRDTLAITPPLRILAMVASPSGPNLDALDIVEERRRIQEATRALQESGAVELVWLEGQTWRDLDRAMRRGPWHVFHFTGHGRYDPEVGGTIVLANESGGPDDRDARALALLLDVQPSLRLAVLNACSAGRTSDSGSFSSVAATLVRRGIPAVVAMQYDITDKAAIEFSRSFYEALSDNFPIDAAVAQARKAMKLAIDNSMEWGTPVLFTHSSDGILFKIDHPAHSIPLTRRRVAESVSAAPKQQPIPPQPVEPTRVASPPPSERRLTPDELRHRAVRATNESNWDRAIPLWEELLRVQAAPDVFRAAGCAYRKRATLLIARGDYRRAAADLGRAVELMPDDLEMLIQRGQTYDKAGDFRRATDDFTAAIARAPEHAAAYALRGRVYHAQRAYDQAIADFERAALVAPEHADRYLFWAGASHVCTGQFLKAIDAYSRAIAVRPDEATYYVQRGRSYRWAGEDALARRDYEQALALDPDAADTYFDQSLPLVLP